ncbi:MAG: hypothetical protein WDM96_02955 [Lacunisphaera sp.]
MGSPLAGRCQISKTAPAELFGPVPRRRHQAQHAGHAVHPRPQRQFDHGGSVDHDHRRVPLGHRRDAERGFDAGGGNQLVAKLDTQRRAEARTDLRLASRWRHRFGGRGENPDDDAAGLVQRQLDARLLQAAVGVVVTRIEVPALQHGLFPERASNSIAKSMPSAHHLFGSRHRRSAIMYCTSMP